MPDPKLPSFLLKFFKVKNLPVRESKQAQQAPKHQWRRENMGQQGGVSEP